MKAVYKSAAFVEKTLPIIIGCAVFYCHHRWATMWFPKEIKDLLANTINISGIAVGFLATGEGLLCSLSDNFVVKLLKEHGRFDDMLRYFTWAIFLCLLLAFASLLGYTVELVPFLTEKPYFFSIWLGIFAAAATATIRVLLFLAMILHR